MDLIDNCSIWWTLPPELHLLVCNNLTDRIGLLKLVHPYFDDLLKKQKPVRNKKSITFESKSMWEFAQLLDPSVPFQMGIKSIPYDAAYLPTALPVGIKQMVTFAKHGRFDLLDLYFGFNKSGEPLGFSGDLGIQILCSILIQCCDSQQTFDWINNHIDECISAYYTDHPKRPSISDWKSLDASASFFDKFYLQQWVYLDQMKLTSNAAIWMCENISSVFVEKLILFYNRLIKFAKIDHFTHLMKYDELMKYFHAIISTELLAEDVFKLLHQMKNLNDINESMTTIINFLKCGLSGTDHEFFVKQFCFAFFLQCIKFGNDCLLILIDKLESEFTFAFELYHRTYSTLLLMMKNDQQPNPKIRQWLNSKGKASSRWLVKDVSYILLSHDESFVMQSLSTLPLNIFGREFQFNDIKFTMTKCFFILASYHLQMIQGTALIHPDEFDFFASGINPNDASLINNFIKVHPSTKNQMFALFYASVLKNEKDRSVFLCTLAKSLVQILESNPKFLDKIVIDFVCQHFFSSWTCSSDLVIAAFITLNDELCHFFEMIKYKDYVESKMWRHVRTLNVYQRMKKFCCINPKRISEKYKKQIIQDVLINSSNVDLELIVQLVHDFDLDISESHYTNQLIQNMIDHQKLHLLPHIFPFTDLSGVLAKSFHKDFVALVTDYCKSTLKK